MKLISFLATASCCLMIASCGGNAAKEADSSATTETSATALYETQPVECGQYRAVNYDIEGDNARKGKFDGRIMMAIATPESGDPSAIYVYENGNRTKIDYKVIFTAPFEKGDSGVYKTVDNNGLPVTINTDSTVYVLSFEKKQNQIKIGFDKDAMNVGSYVEMIERITKESSKK